jgi:hypothetical protein
MKIPALVLALALTAAAAFSLPTVTLTGAGAVSFDAMPTIQEAITAFQSNQPLWGFGWEVVPRRMGVGALYMVDFLRDQAGVWYLDWSAQPVYISFHPFGGGSFLDPFLQAGLGSSGRVRLRHEMMGMYSNPLYISIYPFVAGGLALNLDGFLLSAKVSYQPVTAGVPVTEIPAYPTGSIQVAVQLGVSL